MAAGGSTQATPMWTSFLEGIRPTGRCPPRDVTIQTTSPKHPFLYHLEHEEHAMEKQDILLGKVKMNMTPTIG